MEIKIREQDIVVFVIAFVFGGFLGVTVTVSENDKKEGQNSAPKQEGFCVDSFKAKN